jgi:2-C-methyl-D-erythritol 2,4-cyclodiphosphate synthase
VHDEVRVGLGHDIHRLELGGRLVLGGVEIDSAAGFVTHSDGDVLSHALVDAMAGALADGDLGTHFPENDPEAEDARSLDFVAEFGEHVRSAGMRVSALDAFVVLGTVRLRPHIEQMRRNVAAALDIPLERVSVKARSNDGLGLEGEGKAASATAVVLLVPQQT